MRLLFLFIALVATNVYAEKILVPQVMVYSPKQVTSTALYGWPKLDQYLFSGQLYTNTQNVCNVLLVHAQNNWSGSQTYQSGRYEYQRTYADFHVYYGPDGVQMPQSYDCGIKATTTETNLSTGAIFTESMTLARLTFSGGLGCADGSLPVRDYEVGSSHPEAYKCEVEYVPEPEPELCEAGNQAVRISYAFLSGSPNPPASICTAGCVHSYKGVEGIGMSEPTVPGLFKYWVKYESTTEACEGETPQEDPPPAPDPDPSEPGDGDGNGSGNPDPEKPTTCPPGYSPGPNTDTCFKNPDPDKPGGDGDGDGGGSGPGDGGGSGPGDGGGSGPGDGGGSGPGDGGGSGPGDGGGSGPGNGSGSGSGSGDGEGEGEEEGDGEYKPGEGDSVCNAKPECSGDVIQCGIVDQQWRTRCDFEKAYDYEGNKDKIEGLLDGEKFELLESGDPVEVPSFLNMHARWLGSSSCPSDETISLRTGGGRTFSLSYEPLCTAATTISPLLIIIATVLATLYIGRGSEG